VIVLGGIEYANSVASWLQYKPNDPLNNTAAAVHMHLLSADCTALSCVCVCVCVCVNECVNTKT
jgi:hypothetical protein